MSIEGVSVVQSTDRRVTRAAVDEVDTKMALLRPTEKRPARITAGEAASKRPRQVDP